MCCCCFASDAIVVSFPAYLTHIYKGKLLSFLLNFQPFETMAQSQQTSAAIGLASATAAVASTAVAVVALNCSTFVSWGKVDFMSRPLAMEKLVQS